MGRGRSTLLAAAAACGATLLIGGIAWAAIPGNGGVISACYGKSTGIVRVIDTAKNQKCISGLETAISWNQQGPQGTAGAAGAKGATGATGATGQRGAAGAPGAAGTPGVSPTVAQLTSGDSHCPAGGAAITDAAGHTAYVCSGADGTDGGAGAFSGTFTSPNGQYALSVTDTGISLKSNGTEMLKINGSTLNVLADNLTVTAALNTTLTSGINTTILSGASTSLTTGANLDVSTGANTSLTTGNDFSSVVGSDSQFNSGGNTTLQIGGATSIDTDGLDVDSSDAVSFDVNGDLSFDAAGRALLNSLDDVEINADVEFTTHSGKATIIDSSSSIDIKAQSDVTIKGSHIIQN